MRPTLFACFLLASILSHSQQLPEPYWQRALGGTGNEFAVGFARTFDKGFAVLCNNYQSIDGDIDQLDICYDYYSWVVRLDSNRNILWQNKVHRFKYPSMRLIVSGTDIIQTKDSGIVVIGGSKQATGDESMCWAIKYDKYGKFVWKYEQPFMNRYQDFNEIMENPDGSLIIAGSRNVLSAFSPQEGWLVCLFPNGQLKWQKTYPDTNPLDKNLGFTTIDNGIGGGYIVGGYYDTTSTNAYIASISGDGNLQWFKTYGGNGYDIATNTLSLPDNTYLVAAITNSNNSGDVGPTHCFGTGYCPEEAWLLKIDPNGNLISSVIYGDFEIDKTSDMLLYKDHVYIVGHSNSTLNSFTGNRGGQDVWTLELDYNLSRIQPYGFYGGPKHDHGMSVLIDSSGGEIFPVILATTESESGGQVEGFHDGPALNDKDVWIFKLGYFNTIKGYAFYDHNKNGSKEASEPYYKRGVFTTASNQDTLHQYNQTGNFQFKVFRNLYNTRLTTNDTAFNIVPSSRTSSFVNYFYTDSFHFALQLRPGFSDISIAAYPLMVSRPGFATSYEAMLLNRGGDTILNRQLYLLKDPHLVFDSASPAPLRVSGDSIFWNYTNLKPTDTFRYKVNFTVMTPPTVQINDTLRSYFAAALPNDADTLDNIAYIHQTVRGSFDPNIKVENHNGRMEVSRARSGEFLTYTIFFQNTGNDTAFLVTVKDTLDPNIQTGSLEILKTSHSCSFSMKNRIAQWRFNNINLPDSNTNERASHGYIIYRVKTKKSVSPNSYVNNTASIYFDFNLPVKTDIASTYLWGMVTAIGDPPVSTKTTGLFPNPAKNSFWLSYQGSLAKKASIGIYSISGELIQLLPDQLLRSSTPLKIDLPFLSNGIYCVRLIGATIHESHLLMILR